MSSITDAISQIKSRLTEQLPPKLIDACLGQPIRDRFFNPVLTTSIFARQILHGNCSIDQLRRETKRRCCVTKSSLFPHPRDGDHPPEANDPARFFYDSSHELSPELLFSVSLTCDVLTFPLSVS